MYILPVTNSPLEQYNFLLQFLQCSFMSASRYLVLKSPDPLLSARLRLYCVRRITRPIGRGCLGGVSTPPSGIIIYTPNSVCCFNFSLRIYRKFKADAFPTLLLSHNYTNFVFRGGEDSLWVPLHINLHVLLALHA